MNNGHQNGELAVDAASNLDIPEFLRRDKPMQATHIAIVDNPPDPNCTYERVPDQKPAELDLDPEDMTEEALLAVIRKLGDKRDAIETTRRKLKKKLQSMIGGL